MYLTILLQRCMFDINKRLNMKTFIQFFILCCFLMGYLTSNGQNLHDKHANLPCLNKEFSIVVHIVQDSLGNDGITQANIQSLTDSLNVAFAPICVKFSICEFNQIANFQFDTLTTLTNNEWDQLLTLNHKANRINLFFVGDSDVMEDECGFATFEGITDATNGGLFIHKNSDCTGLDNDKALIHLMGHYFGLLNTFEGSGNELVDGSNCTTAGDLICDTPADPYSIGSPVNTFVNADDNCRFISILTDSNGALYRPDVGNYMSYYQNECGCGFTYGQYLKMANTYLNSPQQIW